MRLEQLFYIVEIAQSRSISLAAERLHISQPSMSQAISNLEKELGVKLFERTRTGTLPTETGEIVVKKAKEILNKIEELKVDATSETYSVTGNLSIAVIPSICLSLLPKTMAIFKQKYTKVNLTIKEKGSFKVIDDIKTGKSDLGLMAMPSASADTERIFELFENEQIHFERLCYDEVMACSGKTSPLSLTNPISIKEIVRYPIVIFNPEYSMHYYITRMLKKHGEPNILFSTGNTEATKRIIAEGLAIGFYTKLSLKTDPYVENNLIIPLHISDEAVSVAYGWIHSKRHHFPVAGEKFVRILKSQCQYNNSD